MSNSGSVSVYKGAGASLNPDSHLIICFSNKRPAGKDLRNKKRKKKDLLINNKLFPNSFLCNIFLNTFTDSKTGMQRPRSIPPSKDADKH